MSRFKLIVAEAVRSLGANISTTFAATTTVLIGMFMLGLVVGLGSWALSLEPPLQEAAARERRLLRAAPLRHRGDRRADGPRSHRLLLAMPQVKTVRFVSKAQALAEHDARSIRR